MRSGQAVPLPAPAEEREAGDVGEVRDGAVGVAVRVGGLAAAVRLDALADLAVAVGRPARLQVLLDREVAVGRLAVDDPLGADRPGEADVDHVRVSDVQADLEADRRRPSPRPAPRPATTAARWPAAGRGCRSRACARGGTRSRGRRATTLAKMWPWLKYQRETVNDSSATRSRLRRLSGRRRSARPSRKTAQKPSHTGHELIFLPPKAPPLPPRAIFQATCGPVHASVDDSVEVVDSPARDLAGLARPDADVPVVVRAVVRSLLDEARLRIAREPVLDLRHRLERENRLGLRQVRLRRGRSERSLNEAPLLVVAWRGRRSGRERRRDDDERERSGDEQTTHG